MKLQGDYTFDAPQELVWSALKDPAVLGSVMPGGKEFEEKEENEFAGSLSIKVGPVQGDFTANIKLSDVVEPERYNIAVDGQGSTGYVKATGGIKLENRGEQTYMEYAGDAQISGRIASVGQRLMDSTAKSIVRQSLNGLNEYLKAQVAAQQSTSDDVSDTNETDSSETTNDTKPTPVPDYQPPSEAQVAFQVMRDVFDDMVPSALQPWVIIGVLAIIAFILYLIFS